MTNPQAIIVGGGLAGLSAAHTVLERGGRVLVVDKNSFFGGNSTKATSGINGALTRTQIKLGIPDSVEKFYEDTANSARDLIRPALVEVLTGRSASAVEWLQEKFQLDLSLVSRLGGHSFPRTHRGKERFPGMTITYALMERLEEAAEKDPQRVRLLKRARVVRLITAEEHTKAEQSTAAVIGVEIEQRTAEGHVKMLREYGPVVLATGGYAADFSESSLLKRYRSDLYHLPTTNGDHSTGDGIKMVSAIGGNSIDMEKVQVHPTGLVDPAEPDAKVKFLAAEALRGVGGLLLDSEGHRFCDELGHRDYVTGEMWKHAKAPYRLVLNSAAGHEIEWHCKHYIGRGLMKHFSSVDALAREMNVPSRVLHETFRNYNECATKNKDPFGKKFFHNLPFKPDDEFFVSIVTPVLHFCMGGLEIDASSHVLAPGNRIIPGLFAAGEVAGGVHGANRLGGSSLLGCVVFGRVAGDSVAQYLLRELTSHSQSLSKRIGTLAHHLTGTTPSDTLIQTRVDVDPTQRRLQLEMVWPEQFHSHPPKQISSTGPLHAETKETTSDSPSTMVPVGPSSQVPSGNVDHRTREWSVDEVAKHNTERDCWVIVNGQVLDVSKFLPDHPGGKKAILIYAGKDASAEFNMLHKPDVVEKYAPYAIIGRIKANTSSSS